ncbi:internal scaffolding protein [robinz microvirus RP_144]|nr:internal scaffolding protein [robinz microvirus RP_144]
MVEIYSILNPPKGGFVVYPGKDDRKDLADHESPIRSVHDILEHYTRHGVLPPNLKRPQDAVFADFSDLPDLQTSYDRISKAEYDFEKLDAKTKAFYHDDPLEFVHGILNGNYPPLPSEPPADPVPPVPAPASSSVSIDKSPSSDGKPLEASAHSLT